MKTKTQKQLIVVSIISFVVTIFLLTSSIFAWISLSKQAGGSFITQTTDISSNLEFYIYRDPLFNGSNNKLTSDECLAPGDVGCFEQIINPKVSQIITPDLKPSDKMSFAIKITNLSSKKIDIRLSFGGVTSTGYIENYNKIQRAFLYEVTAIRYSNNNSQGTDIKSTSAITTSHFSNEDSPRYVLLDEFALQKKDNTNSQVVVYFDLYYDESIHGLDESLQSTGNSNAFMYQEFEIKHFFIELDI